MDANDDVPLPPEAPVVVNARIVQHPESDQSCLLVTTEEGEHLAFGFEIDSDAPGLVIVDPRLWLEAAREGVAEAGELQFDAVTEAWPDEWLQTLVADPVGAEWLDGIKSEHPVAYSAWFGQTDYEEGGEGG